MGMPLEDLEQLSQNQASKADVYVTFKALIMDTHGLIQWREHSEEKDMVVMTDFDGEHQIFKVSIL